MLYYKTVVYIYIYIKKEFLTEVTWIPILVRGRWLWRI